MSIISSMVHHEIHDLPNDVHNIPEPTNETLNKGYDEKLSPQSKKQMHALKNNTVRPAMYYTEDVRRPCKNGAWQDSHTVESEVELREETPRG